MTSTSAQQELATLEAALAAGTLVLVPNHRGRQQLQDILSRRQVQASGNPVLRTLAVKAIDPWLGELWQQLSLLLPSPVLGWHILQPAQELLLWRQVIAGSDAGAALLNIDGTAASARTAWRLLQQHRISAADLRATLSFERLPGELPDDRQIFQQWLATFLKLCRDRQLLTFGDMLHTLLQWIDDDPEALRSVLPASILLRGFDETPPLYRSLLDAMKGLGVAMVPGSNITNEPTVQVNSYADVADECRAAVRWARERLATEPGAAIALVCPDLQGLHAVFARMFAQTFTAIESGHALAVPDLRPLSEQPFIATALQLPELLQDSCDTLLLCQLLRSPWLIGANPEADERARMEQHLRGNGELRTSMATFREACLKEDKGWHCPLLGEVLLELARLHPSSRKAAQPMSQWLQLFGQLWTLLLDRAQLPATGNAALGQAWDTLQDTVLQSAFLYGNCSLHEAHKLVLDIARESRLAPPSGATAIQMLTPVETAGLHFSHAWCMQMTENHWPDARPPSPWLPLALQATHELPGADPQLALARARQLLAKLQAMTSIEVVFSHALVDKDLPQRASQLIPVAKAKLDTQGDPINPAIQTTQEHAAAGSAAVVQRKHIPASLHPVLQHFTAQTVVAMPEPLMLPLQGSDLREGPGALLADQARCPFRAMAIHRFRTVELQEPAYGLPASAIGNLVHYTLEHFWNVLHGSHALQQATPAQLLLAMNSAASDALRRIAQWYPHTMTPRYQAVLHRHLLRLLDTWLEQERRRGPFNVVGSEERLQWRYANLQLQLRVDRIDRADDGSSVVIDYKTGRVGTVDWEAERQDNPQLMLYQLAVEQSGRHAPVSALLHARVSLDDGKYSGIGADAQVLPDIAFTSNNKVASVSWEALLAHWQLTLERLAQEFLDGHVAIRPLAKKSCDYCHLQRFCRIADAGEPA